MKNTLFELEEQFKEYLKLKNSQNTGIESIIEEGKLKNREKSKLKRIITYKEIASTIFVRDVELMGG